MTVGARTAAAVRLALLVCLAVLAVGVAPVTAARLVGIVYDDSGSMAGRVNLPAFGAQVLASTLDGRPGHDQLLTARLSVFNAELSRSRSALAGIRKEHAEASPEAMRAIERLGFPFVREESFATAQGHQDLLDSMRTNWARANGGTPYEPLELVLKELVERTGPDDQAFLIVLTDGAFFDGKRPGPGPAALEAVFKRYKQRLKGSLRVEFILIGPDAETRGKVEDQGVRSGLLKVFNGGTGDGNHVVDEADDLRRALFDITARISATDTSAANRFSQVDDDRIVVSSPFSIARISSIAAGAADNPVPDVVETSFDREPSAILNSAMQHADTAAGWRNERLRAITRQYRFFPAMPAGPVTLRYDRPVGEGVMLLVEIGTRLNFTVRNAKGDAVPPNADGVVDLLQGHAYKLEATLDEPAAIPNGRIPFDFSKLPPAARISAWIDPGGGRAGLPLTVETARSRAHGLLPTAEPGAYEVGGTFTVPGFVVQEGTPLKLRVVSPDVGYALAVAGEAPCPDCAANELRAEFRPGMASDSVGRVVISQVAGRPSAVTVALRDAPSWLSLVDAAGAPVGPDHAIAMSEGHPLTLNLQRNLSGVSTLGRQVNPFTIDVRAVPPQEGEASAAVNLVVVSPDVRITYAGHTRGSSTDAPLTLSGADLNRGDQGLFFEIENAPFLPRADRISVDAIDGLPDTTVEVHDHRLAVRLRSDCSGCTLWLYRLTGALPETLTLHYRFIDDVEPAAATVPIRIEPTIDEILWGCGVWLLYLAVAIHALLVVRTIFATQTFPKGSMAQVLDRNATLPRYEDLHRFSFVRVLLWMLLVRAHERRSVEGLLLEARPDGAAVIVQDSDAAFIIERLGQNIGQISQDQPALRNILIFWGERLNRPKGAKSLILVREFQEG